MHVLRRDIASPESADPSKLQRATSWPLKTCLGLSKLDTALLRTDCKQDAERTELKARFHQAEVVDGPRSATAIFQKIQLKWHVTTQNNRLPSLCPTKNRRVLPDVEQRQRERQQHPT